MFRLTIDPVACSILGFPIYWYGLAYVLSFWGATWIVTQCVVTSKIDITSQELDRLFFHGILGTLLGGRLGYILIYAPHVLIENPLEIFMTWRGGMSFHGGLVGVVVAVGLYLRCHGLPLFFLLDCVCLATPQGLFWGRLANFINQEHIGTPTHLPWSVIFARTGGDLSRHPTQIYEALGEGLLLGIILLFIWRRYQHRPGVTSFSFLIGYGLIRWILEYVREPDGLFSWGWLSVSTGQALCFPMILGGLWGFFSIHQRRCSTNQNECTQSDNKN